MMHITKAVQVHGIFGQVDQPGGRACGMDAAIHCAVDELQLAVDVRVSSIAKDAAAPGMLSTAPSGPAAQC
jgi:hypothetical protein